MVDEGPHGFEVRIGAHGPRFEVAAGQTLLQAAESRGIAMPSSCRNGSCRTCMQRLEGGRVGYRIAWPGLLAEEKAQGWILPCVAYPASDLVLSPGPSGSGAQELPVV
ncbi:2Fe-2S iron-sulfur cluster-binding protein [Ramlibacter tataouinensis]|uniref:Ferredoxin--NAD(+) reductase-like protein n=1 Tax=Ramlibacter tataouinensis (strain ATCC BAA-407 / DSM 14655 / LMG 21543 / TTB310) TaxID=365046 RepID=F5Y532_RAMTT|nr:2Fe-2S iron-sulfur cluster binding domain-containing protein [Ramlibacter tataouinensis]AEG93872.1 Ferredoxin--NAD(+) reductase-like protein [Ramlibacter tataouinensis TTB310]